ncbi:hypothetical protein [Leucobacter chromiiresistens]|uniref:Uncharacterized protein n=1 Tax=Leucobacter chromiiresistens TaxID=1079994 RepID=A0A147ECH0_9MICO|nr:hypothetical protein [Leucobacter chromiiresistens]KTR82128.1 hypothetical protein NS354_11450 [Leucobacter chromiiresistens]
MSQSDLPTGLPAREPADAAPAAGAPAPGAPASGAPAAPTPESTASAPGDAPVEREPIVEVSQREVTIERSVRVGRIVIGGIVAGAVIAMLACLFFPIEEGAEYTLGQIVGFMALIGAAIGAGLAGLVAILLGAAVRRQRGTGIAIQSDVR